MWDRMSARRSPGGRQERRNLATWSGERSEASHDQPSRTAAWFAHVENQGRDHDYVGRRPRGAPDVATEICIRRYICANKECQATWRILPAFLARHLWRVWPTVERVALPATPPAVVPATPLAVPVATSATPPQRSSRRRWQCRWRPPRRHWRWRPPRHRRRSSRRRRHRSPSGRRRGGERVSRRRPSSSSYSSRSAAAPCWRPSRRRRGSGRRARSWSTFMRG